MPEFGVGLWGFGGKYVAESQKKSILTLLYFFWTFAMILCYYIDSLDPCGFLLFFSVLCCVLSERNE